MAAREPVIVNRVGNLHVASRAGVEITYGRWGAGPRWIATLRLEGAYFEPVTRWFASQAVVEAWRDAVLSAEPEHLWEAALAPEPYGAGVTAPAAPEGM